MNKTCVSPFKKAKELKDHYKSSDPFKLCRYLEIEVMFGDLGNTSGIHQTEDGICIIHINSKLSQKKKYVACAHELGHAILHYNLNENYKQSNNYFIMRMLLEMEANAFAIELLFKDTTIRNRVLFKDVAGEIIESSIDFLDKYSKGRQRELIVKKLKEYIPDSKYIMV